MRRLVRVLLMTLALLLILGAGIALWTRAEVRASLPRLDGEAQVPGLSAAVTITRDVLGIPTIRAGSRVDAARATGYVHGQDRFFQMDLARRRAAGELATLVGQRALDADRDARRHRFRAEAQQALTLMPPADRALFEAYAAGVNAGIAQLGARPFEYLLLRQQPAPWRPEDCLLVVLSMFLTLQDSTGAYESTLATMHDTLPPAVVEFLAPTGTEWDAPITGPALAVPAVPDATIYDPRERRRGRPPIGIRPRGPDVTSGPRTSWRDHLVTLLDPTQDTWRASSAREGALGSNNWALLGRLMDDGRAWVANDMHLAVRVPNIWYRASLQWSDGAGTHTLSGVTLPGVPALVVGSNTHVAWGFTNTYADWSDLVVLEIDPDNASRYRTADGWRTFDEHVETIKIAGLPDEHHRVRWTIWGPVVANDHRGRPRAFRWVAHSAERLAVSWAPLEVARTIEQAFDAANGLGAPGQNFVVADRNGHIGWSIFGSLPRRTSGGDGRLPATWADASHGWSGWLPANEYPRVIDPSSGRIWTANARVVDGDMLAKLGDGSYEVGSRAYVIRDRLFKRDRFTRDDLLAIQLDTRADFLERWRELILRTLTPATITAKASRAAFLDTITRTWSGEASPDSASYRLTRMFREEVSLRVLAFALAECYEADPAFDYTTVRRREGPIWKLVTEQPLHWLDPQYETWSELLVASTDAVIESIQRDYSGTLGDRVWSEYNITRYRHPLSSSVPLFDRWLDMPARPLAGDLFTPNMHWGTSAPSQRMIVSPGQEERGIMQMPTGQSGHPLSPFYGNSHDAWVKGAPTPFLPGAAVHTLRLVP